MTNRNLKVRELVQAIRWALLFWCLLSLSAFAGDLAVPRAALPYRAAVAAAAHRSFGVDAPTATLAAQLHQESAWNADARSPVGALGLAQFMPSTASDLAQRRPDLCAPADPLDPRWAIRCQSAYMAEQLAGVQPFAHQPPMSECSRWAMALSAYNGGAGWVLRDRRTALAHGANPNRWFGHVERTPDPRRAARYVRENRGYPARILLRITPVYADASWGRGVVCTPEVGMNVVTLPAALSGYLGIDCPGCGHTHLVNIVPSRYVPSWAWNGSLTAPTLSPAVRDCWTEGEGHAEQVCHFVLRDGQMQFGPDSTHALAGLTVPLQRDLAAQAEVAA